MTLTHSPTFMDSAGLTIMLTILVFAGLMLFICLCISTDIRRALCATCIITSISTAISFGLVHLVTKTGLPIDAQKMTLNLPDDEVEIDNDIDPDGLPFIGRQYP